MATKEDIKKAFDEIKAKYKDKKFKKYQNYSKNIQFIFLDLNTSFLVDIAEGKIKSIEEKTISEPDVIVTTDSNTFLDIFNKKIKPLRAFRTGKLKFEGATLIDLLRLQKVL